MMKSSSLAALLLLSGSSSGDVVNDEKAGPTTNLQRCLEPGEFDPDVDYFPEKYVPHSTSDHFTVTYHKSYKVVHNKYNDKSYILYQCGADPPSDAVQDDHHITIPVPHTGGVAATQTPQLPPLELLGLRSEIKAYAGNPTYISSSCLNQMMDDGTMKVLYDTDDSSMTEVMIASWISDNPDALILGGPGGANKEDKRVVSVAASQERTNIATFDWIGYLAAFFNLEKKAMDIAADTQVRYDCSAANAASVTADAPDSDKPTMLWANYIGGFEGFAGGWSVAECPTSDAAYYCENAKHCGINLLSRPEGVGYSKTWGGPTLYWYLSNAELLQLGKDADYWINPDKDWYSLVADPEMKDFLMQFKAVQTEQVYDTQGQGPNAWHEQRLAEYDVVALDMCSIVGNVNPTQDPPHVLQWMRNIIKETPIGSQGECDVSKINDPYKSNAAECTLLEGVEVLVEQNSVEDESSSSRSRVSVIGVSVLAIAFVVLAA